MMISDMYGCPEAVALMEGFYGYMTKPAASARRRIYSGSAEADCIL